MMRHYGRVLIAISIVLGAWSYLSGIGIMQGVRLLFYHFDFNLNIPLFASKSNK